MSRALITGATGQIGSYIAERLLADGWDVRAMVRDPDKARAVLPDARVELARGDVLDERSFIAAARGCHTIFHAAAHIIVSGGWESFRATNIDGTQNAISAAEAARARLMHVSSVAVYGPSSRYLAARRGEKTSEQMTLADMPEGALYARSKRESEALVMQAHNMGRVWATAVRPCVVYGRRDRQFVPRMAKLIRHAVIPLLRGGRATLAVVHAENVAQGAVLAATSDLAGGKAYNLANDFPVSARRFFELAGEGLGVRPRFLPVPMWFARGALAVGKTASRLVTGGRFRLASNSALDFLAEDNPFTSELARRELGWQPGVRPEFGVPDAFAWQAVGSTYAG